MTLKQLRQALEEDTGPISDEQDAFLRRVWDILHPTEKRGAGPHFYDEAEMHEVIKKTASAWDKATQPQAGAGWMDICPGSERDKSE